MSDAEKGKGSRALEVGVESDGGIAGGNIELILMGLRMESVTEGAIVGVMSDPLAPAVLVVMVVKEEDAVMAEERLSDGKDEEVGLDFADLP